MSALIASLFAVGAAPAAALDEDSKPDAAAATSACVGDATGDMMFSDVSEMHTFRGDINCLAYYGVTIGYGDGTFGPENDVTRGQMVLFMERAAGVAGADAEAVVGDFATTGSDPVNRADMALLIARLLVSATNDESPVNVTNGDDGTFAVAVDGTAVADWDYFADARRSLNRIHDSAVSALYELGVAKGTGMGYFSPAASVSRGQMAAFITRALAHTTARPSGVTIQSHAPGEVIVSVRDANFHPVANAQIDLFSIDTAKVGEAFDGDGKCGRVAAVDSNDSTCAIDALDPVSGLSGDYSASAGTVADGGTTVWAWTGQTGDAVEDGGEGLASIDLTEGPAAPAASVSIKDDMATGATRAVFGSTVTVTIQLVDSDGNPAGPPDGGASYRVVTMRDTDTNEQTDAAVTTPVAAGDSDGLTTNVLTVDSSGKATFTITAADPDPTDRNNPDGAPSPADPVVPNRIDRVRVSYTVTAVTGTTAPADPTDDSQTIVFSDAAATVTGGSLMTATSYLSAPTNGGTASNVATVTVVDQYARPMRGQYVRLTSNHSATPDSPPADADLSTFPIRRRTDSSGTVRIGYSHSGTGSREALAAHISVINDQGTPDTSDDTEEFTAIAGATTNFNWVSPATTASANALAGGAGDIVRIANIEKRLLVVGGDASNAPVLVPYDAGDQFAVGAVAGSEPLVSISEFETALAGDKGNNDLLAVSSFDDENLNDVARFVLTTVVDP